jgi:hypothetical protein
MDHFTSPVSVSMMTVILMPLSLIMVYLTLTNTRPAWGWRTSFLRSVVLLAGYMVLSNEVLSLLDRINTLTLCIVWLLPSGVLAFFLIHLKRTGLSIRWNLPTLPSSGADRILLLLLAGVLVITAVVAWIAPPNTWDSLNTHMSRVAHWAQNSSLKPFATGIEKQNYYPPLPAISILQSYVLTGGDKLANFSQWFAMLVSIIVASLIAAQIGVSTTGQIFAGVFIATLPMGIAQASSTMTDYLVAMWMTVVASEVIMMSQNRQNHKPVVFMGLAAALAINTKPTAFTYLLPFAIYVAYVLLRSHRFREFLGKVILVVILVILVNIGYFGRNLQVYGSPLGTGGDITVHRNEMLNLRVLISNTLRNAALHAGSPFRILNRGIYFVLDRIHKGLGLSLTDPRTSVHPGFVIRPPTTEEAKSGNPIHALLILFAIAYLMLKRMERNSMALVYSGLVVLTFLLLSIIFKFSVFGSRYHLPFFVLFAPVVGGALEKSLPRRYILASGILIFVASWSWLVRLQERPLLPEDGDGMSILNTSREELYFVLSPGSYKVYQDLVHRTQEQECRAVAIALRGTAAEYPFWVLMGSPRDDLEIEWIVAGTPSAQFRVTHFQPCVVVCDSSCPAEWEDVRGLPLAHERADFRLFLQNRQ